MQRYLTIFLVATAIIGALTALCLWKQSYFDLPTAAGLGRIGALADITILYPLAAIYGVSAALTLLLPLRAAALVYNQGAEAIISAALVVTGAIVGSASVLWLFGSRGALQDLVEWRYLLVPGAVLLHLQLNTLRRSLPLRIAGAVALIAATIFILFYAR